MKKAKKQFDLIETLVEAIKNGQETIEQLEYTLQGKPQVIKAVKEALKGSKNSLA